MTHPRNSYAHESARPKAETGDPLAAGARPLRVLHIINDLSVGGAEMTLYKLLRGLNRQQFAPAVVSLMDRGPLRARIAALGIPVLTPAMRRSVPTPASLRRFVRIVKAAQPDLIHGWMYHGDLAAQVGKVAAFRQARVIWGIRNTLYSLSLEKRMTAAVIRACALLSGLPDKIVYASHPSKSQHEAAGFCAQRSRIIPNGFDISLFAPAPAARRGVRSELGLPEDALLIGLIGRYHPMKDHAGFLRAAAALLQTNREAHFLLVGRDVNGENEELRRLIAELDIAARVRLLGERSDIPRLTSALDLLSSASSYGESFPNVIAEAMACEVPCVATDIGDSRWILGDTGRLIPPRNPAALAKAWQELIALGAERRKALGSAARQRVKQLFSIEAMIAQYEALYAETCAGNSTNHSHLKLGSATKLA